MTEANQDAVERVEAWLDENPESVGHDISDPPRAEIRAVLALARHAVGELVVTANYKPGRLIGCDDDRVHGLALDKLEGDSHD